MTQSSFPSEFFAPAKLNLFLHITGRRADGYHTLQSVFQLLDWGDRLSFTPRPDGLIRQLTPIPGVPEQCDLTVRAAYLLQTYTGCQLGVEIEIDKRLPIGAGLGGGSSDAATTLLALNRLWRLELPRAELLQLARQLGADVPFFVFGHNAFAEGIGDALVRVDLLPRYFLIVTPDVQVPTAEIFSAADLTRHTKPIRIIDFLDKHACSDHFGRNDMQPVVLKKYPEVAQVIDWFESIEPPVSARMTGSGASVFATFASQADGLAAQAKAPRLPAGWRSIVVPSLAQHPLLSFAP